MVFAFESTLEWFDETSSDEKSVYDIYPLIFTNDVLKELTFSKYVLFN